MDGGGGEGLLLCGKSNERQCNNQYYNNNFDYYTVFVDFYVMYIFLWRGGGGGVQISFSRIEPLK